MWPWFRSLGDLRRCVSGLLTRTRARRYAERYFMRRLRPGEPGALVLIDATPAGSPVIVREQIAADGDIRKLLDRARKRLGDALRGKSTPSLAPTWSLGPIEGGPTRAATEIRLDNDTADDYLDRVLERIAADVIDEVVTEWLADAIPETGDGVDTEPTVSTSGGPLP